MKKIGLMLGLLLLAGSTTAEESRIMTPDGYLKRLAIELGLKSELGKRVDVNSNSTGLFTRTEDRNLTTNTLSVGLVYPMTPSLTLLGSSDLSFFSAGKGRNETETGTGVPFVDDVQSTVNFWSISFRVRYYL